MKQDIHTTYYKEATVTCNCGNTFTTGSSLPSIHIEICSKCHPFFTGTQKLIDTGGRVDRYKKRLSKQTSTSRTKQGRKVKTTRRATGKAKKTKILSS